MRQLCDRKADSVFGGAKVAKAAKVVGWHRLYRLYHLSRPPAGELSGYECWVAASHPKIFRASG